MRDAAGLKRSGQVTRNVSDLLRLEQRFKTAEENMHNTSELHSALYIYIHAFSRCLCPISNNMHSKKWQVTHWIKHDILSKI